MRTNCSTQTMLKNVEKLHRQCWYKRTIFLEFLFFFSGHVLWHRIWILCKEVTDSISFLSVAIPCFCGWQKVHNLSKFSGRLQYFFVLKMMKAISVHTAAVLYVRVHCPKNNLNLRIKTELVAGRARNLTDFWTKTLYSTYSMFIVHMLGTYCNIHIRLHPLHQWLAQFFGRNSDYSRKYIA